jgi:hypothetical protein
MKRFSLKEYLKNPARKVVTREGNSVEIVYTDGEGRRPIVALITKEDGKKVGIGCTKYGEWSENGESALDLFFEPIKKEGWVNIYNYVYNYVSNKTTGDVYSNKEEAIKNINFNFNSNFKYITTVKIEWEE